MITLKEPEGKHPKHNGLLVLMVSRKAPWESLRKQVLVMCKSTGQNIYN